MKPMTDVNSENNESRCEWSGTGILFLSALWAICFVASSRIVWTHNSRGAIIALCLCLIFLPVTYRFVRLYFSGPALTMTESGIRYADIIYQWHEISTVKICSGVKAGPSVEISLKSRLYRNPFFYRESRIGIPYFLLKNPTKFVNSVAGYVSRGFLAPER
jgi:hypothetical protein